MTTSVVLSDIGDVSVRDYKKVGTKAAVSYTAVSSEAYIELPLQNYWDTGRRMSRDSL